MGNHQTGLATGAKRARAAYQLGYASGPQRNVVCGANRLSVGQLAAGFSQSQQHLLPFSQMVFGWDMAADQPGLGPAGTQAFRPLSLPQRRRDGQSKRQNDRKWRRTRL